MFKFTNTFNVRRLTQEDFEEVSTRTVNGYKETEYRLCDKFDDENLSVVAVVADDFVSYTISYQDSDKNDVFFTEEDSFEQALDAFNDWRVEMFTSLSFLPNQGRIVWSREQYITRERIQKIESDLNTLCRNLQNDSANYNWEHTDFYLLDTAAFTIKAIAYIADRKQDRIDELEKQLNLRSE